MYYSGHIKSSRKNSGMNSAKKSEKQAGKNSGKNSGTKLGKSTGARHFVALLDCKGFAKGFANRVGAWALATKSRCSF